MYQLPQTLHEKNGNPKNSAGLKKTEGTSSLRLFSKQLSNIHFLEKKMKLPTGERRYR